jgi:hypothetical protein
MGRTRLLAVVLPAAFFLAGGAVALSPSQGAAERLGRPSLADLGPTQARIADTLIADTDDLQAYWGGPHTAATGETVQVFASDTFPQNPALTQSWADFLARLAHGQELSEVEVYLLPLAEIRGICGRGAIGCYSPRDETIVTIADDIPGGPTAESVLTHEYGHHVATNRINPPWDAGDWGTKRWASAANVCARALMGRLFPGDEGANYQLNPGEGMAESYRVLNERRLGTPESPWDVVDLSLYPTEAALRSLEQDVLDPWRANTVVTRSSSFRRVGTKTRTLAVSTPLDGNIQVRLNAPSGRFSLALTSGSRVIARTTSRTLTATVCGQRSLSVRVVRSARGLGAFTVRIARP